MAIVPYGTEGMMVMMLMKSMLCAFSSAIGQDAACPH